MTTIAAKSGVVAADSQLTGGSGRKARVKKLVRLTDGSVFGGAGTYHAVLKLRAWAESGFEGKRPTNTKEAECLLVRPNGEVWSLDSQGDAYQVFGDFHAIGSGGDYALGAMAMGADPLQAIKVAADFDAMTSGPFHVERLYLAGRARKSRKRK